MADKDNGEISTVAKFLEWAKENREYGERSMLYRGLANKEWGVEAGSYRRLHDSITRKNPQRNPQEDLLQVLFAEDNKRLLQKVRMEKYETEGSDLEILAKLQHDGAATCLIDFTVKPLIALWFACQSSSGKNKSGKIVATDRERYMLVTPEDMKKEIQDFLYPESKQPKLWIWEPPGQNNNRIIAQHSVFVFGPPKIPIDENDSCTVEEKNKEKILKELQNMGISAESLFRDYVGFILLNKHDEVYENWPIDGSFYSGLMNQEIGEYKRAIKCYNQVIKLGHENVAVYSNRGNAKGKLGRYKEAIADHDKAINLDSRSARAYNNRGLAKSELGRNEEAILDFDEAIKFDPKDAGAYYNRGNAKRELGQNKEAILDYDEAVNLDSRSARAYNNRGLAKSELGRNEEAILDFDEAIKFDPEYALAYCNLGHTKGELGRNKEAILDFDEAIRFDPKDAVAYSSRGVAKSNLGHYEEAILDYDEAIKFDPEYALAYYNRCLSKIAVGDMEGALMDYQEAKKLAPDDERFVMPEK